MKDDQKSPQRHASPSDTVAVPWRDRIITGPDEATVRSVIADLEAAEERRGRWPEGGAAAMSQLASSFPSLAGAPGVRPWDQNALLSWLCTEGLSHGELLAARFVLGVWNPSTKWDDIAREEGLPFPGHAVRFDFFEAAGVWDRNHLAAFAAWVDAPFFP